MDNTSPIIPQLPDESARAFDARVAYLTMGSGRSLEKLRVQNEGKLGATVRLATLEQWSARYHWQDHARAYDQRLAQFAAAAAAEQYKADLESHRVRYKKAGEALYVCAQGLINTLARSLQGKKIEATDGKTYFIPLLDLTPAALGTAARALTIAADLEAHALNLAELLPLLDKGGNEDG